MKKLLVILSAAALFTVGSAFTVAHHSTGIVKTAGQGYFDIRVENKCSHDVKLRTEAFGSASETTIYKNSSEARPMQAGYKIYVDGEFFREIKEEDSGKTFVICQ